MIAGLQAIIRNEVNTGALDLEVWRPRYISPNKVLTDFSELNPSELKTKGIQAVVIDYDGVLVPYHSENPPSPDVCAKLAELELKFEVCILSNRRENLLKRMQEAIPNSRVVKSTHMKPQSAPYCEALRLVGTEPRHTALIEDRLITGIAGGNRVGMYTIWISPPTMANSEPTNVKLYRAFEEGFLSLYDKLGLLQQNKEKIRKDNELLIDLHFHLGKKIDLRTIIDQISCATDIVTITGRGNKYQNDFEYAFAELAEKFKNEKIPFKKVGELLLRVGDLYLVKGQEVKTAEGQDIVIIGDEKNHPDNVPLHRLVGTSSGVIIQSSITHTPLSGVDGFESYNQNLFWGLPNRIETIMFRNCLPGISVSDYHKYSRSAPINSSGIIVQRDSLDLSSDNKFIESLKAILSSGHYSCHDAFTPFSFLELLNLKPRQLFRLFFGKT